MRTACGRTPRPIIPLRSTPIWEALLSEQRRSWLRAPVGEGSAGFSKCVCVATQMAVSPRPSPTSKVDTSIPIAAGRASAGSWCRRPRDRPFLFADG